MGDILPAGHWLFQAAQVFLFLSYVASDVLVLRTVLCLASVCFVLWAVLVLDVALDTALWNVVFAVINGYYAVALAYARRPIKFARPEHDAVYDELFAPLGFSRLDFKELASQGLLRTLHAGSTFIEAGNAAQNLTVVHKGVLELLSAPKDGSPPEVIGHIGAFQFVESPQWAGIQVARRRAAMRTKRRAERGGAAAGAGAAGLRRALSARSLTVETAAAGAGGSLLDGRTPSAVEGNGVEGTIGSEIAGTQEAALVDVTIKATTDVAFLMWPIERLQEFIAENPQVASPLNALIGADVSFKLFSQGKGGGGKPGHNKSASRVYVPWDPPRARSPTPRPVRLGAAKRLGASAALDDVAVSFADEHHIRGGGDSNSGDGSTGTAGGGDSGAGGGGAHKGGATGGGGGDDSDEANSGPRISAAAATRASGDGSGRIELTGGAAGAPVRSPPVDAAAASARSPVKAEAQWLAMRAELDSANDIRLARILMDRSDLSSYEVEALISRGRWRSIRRVGTVLVREGEQVTHLCMLLDGALQATRGEGEAARPLHRVVSGEMAGSLELLEPEREHLAGETVAAVETPCTFVSWDVDDLRELLAPRPRLRAQLAMMLGMDLARKYRQVETLM